MRHTYSNIIKKLLFGLSLLFLSLPFFQVEFHLLEEEKLNGHIQSIEKININKTSWFNESYQINFEKFMNQNFGFRNTLVRLNNQIAYTFFGTAKANGVIIGKEGYLYEENYIKAYLGADYIGLSEIRLKTNKINKIQNKLKEQGKDLLVVLAPGKGSFFPEFIPDDFISQKKDISNYQSYSEEFKNQNINCIDFNKWFLEMKSTSPFPLYGKGGIHWSKYGEFLAADSLIRYIGKLREIKIPELILDSVRIKKLNQEGDNDIGEALNILTENPTYPMGYPYFHIQKDGNTVQPKVLFIADSYYWGMFNSGISREIFKDGQFWYYNEQIYPDSYIMPKIVSEIDIKEEAEKNDVIVLLSTDANLYKFPFGFIDQLYDIYFIKQTNPSSSK